MSAARIRAERPGDEDAIRALTTAAFAGGPFGAGTEAAIVDALRRDGDLVLSLVAEADGEAVGHVAFSPVRIGGAAEGLFGLGPVCVAPPRQGGGIGSALIEAGLAELSARGARACVLVGDPGYYERFGFRALDGLTYEGIPGRYVLARGVTGEAPTGALAYAPGFEAR